MRKETYKLPVVLDCRYLTGDSQVTIYLRPVSRQKKRWRLSMRTKLRIRRAFFFLIRLGLTLAITVPLSILLLEMVYESRGYFGVGGEYLFIVLMAFGIYCGIEKIL